MNFYYCMSTWTWIILSQILHALILLGNSLTASVVFLLATQIASCFLPMVVMLHGMLRLSTVVTFVKNIGLHIMGGSVIPTPPFLALEDSVCYYMQFKVSRSKHTLNFKLSHFSQDIKHSISKRWLANPSWPYSFSSKVLEQMIKVEVLKDHLGCHNCVDYWP